ncbi:hypothetical protein NXS19_001691 [Fusarium pseudograminearum]|nr:hypothetical protein NXS19_001691 [Fusarium pseudograminearum]
MSQRMPGPGYSSSVPPPIHAYQQQQQHQHPRRLFYLRRQRSIIILLMLLLRHHRLLRLLTRCPRINTTLLHRPITILNFHRILQLNTNSPIRTNTLDLTHFLLRGTMNLLHRTGLKYSLDVQQQPIRARMCGFGDKDRRPITPPPCVRLVIINSETGKEVDYNTLDHAMFVLSVDLWDKDGIKEVNLVRSSTGPGSGASSNNYSYSTLEPSTPSYQQQALPPSRESGYPQGQGLGYGQEYPPSVQQGYGQAPSYQSSSSYGPPQQYFPRHSGYNADPPASSAGPPFRNGYGQDQNALTRMAVVGTQPQGMFTRNLIGSLAASAFRLNDTDKKAGIWFVLQDLSVRTEGNFRLRFSFVNVGGAGGLPIHVNQGRAPILASCFSQDFSVYSAKKFPGVCESTPLSKTFALQGIKIPIRKDTNIKGEGDEEMMYDQN